MFKNIYPGANALGKLNVASSWLKHQDSVQYVLLTRNIYYFSTEK